MATFALVHGAWHGAWCWERVVPELEARGHRAIAVDLPCGDPSAAFATYAEVVIDALVDAEDVVLVGHSLGGMTIPLVAARRPVRRLVYVCALAPMPGRSLREQLRIEPGTLLAPGPERWEDAEAARRVLYHDCDDDTAREAFARLRPQSSAPHSVRCPLDALPPVPSTYVVCADDRVVNPERARHVARERLHADLVEHPGGHSPFLARPRELAATLLAATR